MKNVKIGIGITCHNTTPIRKKISEESFRWITAKSPAFAEIVLVDDGSTLKSEWNKLTPPKTFLTIIEQENLGVAKAKNRCLEVLIQKGCTDLFLFDDDCWFADPKYYYEYAYQDLPHLNPYPKEHINNPKKIYSHFIFRERKYVEAFPYGSCLYFRKELIECIGGFNILLGKFGEEHSELEERIYKQKFTPKQSFDLYRPNEDYPVIIHPLTFHNAASSMDPTVKRQSILEAQNNRKIYGGIKCPFRSSEYPEFEKLVRTT